MSEPAATQSAPTLSQTEAKSLGTLAPASVAGEREVSDDEATADEEDDEERIATRQRNGLRQGGSSERGSGLLAPTRGLPTAELKELGRLVTYILMQVMLQRALVARLTMPDGRFSQVLHIPEVQVDTIALPFANAAVAQDYLSVVQQLQARADDDRDKRRRRLQLLYKMAPASPVSNIVEESHGRAADLWYTTRAELGLPKLEWYLSLPASGRAPPTWHMPPVGEWSVAARTRHIRRMCQGAPKLRWLAERLRRLAATPGEKLLVWRNWRVSQWTATLSCLAHGIEVRALTAGVATKELRTDLVNRFDAAVGDPTVASPIRVLVMSFRVGGVGLNLWPQCHENVVLEGGPNYATEYQGWCRIRRIGQTHVQVTNRLVNRETLDTQHGPTAPAPTATATAGDGSEVSEAWLAAILSRSAVGDVTPAETLTLWQQMGLAVDFSSSPPRLDAPLHWGAADLAPMPVAQSCRRLHRFTQVWHAHFLASGPGRNQMTAIGLMGVMEFWGAWLHDHYPRLTAGEDGLSQADRALRRHVTDWLSRVPDGISHDWIYRLDVVAWLHQVHMPGSSLPAPPCQETYEAVHLRWPHPVIYSIF
ncbi:MAG: hypothetical protein M1826_006519 [Phylliscum demangeonii]|nr:MAG: hypothetical protein M1826_006519 [Phylliscum demangeonii]